MPSEAVEARASSFKRESPALSAITNVSPAVTARSSASPYSEKRWRPTVLLSSVEYSAATSPHSMSSLTSA